MSELAENFNVQHYRHYRSLGFIWIRIDECIYSAALCSIVQHSAACCSTNPSHFRLQKVSLKAKQLLASLGLDAVPEARAWRALRFAKSKSRGMVWFNARNVCGLVKITQDY